MAQKNVCVQTVIIMTYTLLVQSFVMSEATEPMCSKFHYDEQLLEKMIRTEIKVESMNQEIKKTEDKVTNTLETLQKDIQENQKLAESTIKEQLDNLSKEKDALKTELETSITQQEAQIARMSQDLRKLENDTIGNLKEIALTPTILFKARDLADNSPSSNEHLIFKNNLFNIGEAYDISTGIFTAPASGVYLFTVHFCTAGASKYIVYAIVVNDNIITEADVGDKSYTICDASDAMVHMTKGMTAWVKHVSGSGYRTSGRQMNSFSGLLVHI